MQESEYIPDDDEINIKEWALAFWKRRVLFLRLFIVINIIVLVVSLLTPKQFKAEGTFLVVSGASQLGVSQLAGLAGFGIDSTKPSALQMMGIVKSREIAKRAIEKIGAEKISQDFHFEKVPAIDDPDLLEAVMTSIEVKKDKNEIYSLTAVAYSREMALALNKAYINELGRFLNEAALSINFRVIDEAVSPRHKFKPSVRKNLFSASAFIVLLFAFMTIGLEMWEKKSFSPFAKNNLKI